MDLSGSLQLGVAEEVGSARVNGRSEAASRGAVDGTTVVRILKHATDEWAESWYSRRDEIDTWFDDCPACR